MYELLSPNESYKKLKRVYSYGTYHVRPYRPRNMSLIYLASITLFMYKHGKAIVII
jgi:hypothetical protein